MGQIRVKRAKIIFVSAYTLELSSFSHWWTDSYIASARQIINIIAFEAIKYEKHSVEFTYKNLKISKIYIIFLLKRFIKIPLTIINNKTLPNCAHMRSLLRMSAARAPRTFGLHKHN